MLQSHDVKSKLADAGMRAVGSKRTELSSFMLAWSIRTTLVTVSSVSLAFAVWP